MDESVFGAGFDLQDYIHKRSLDIQDLRERALYRQVTDTLMVNLFQYLGDEQKKLEQRILSEIQSRESEFTIHIGVTEPDLYDASDRFLTPICPEDVEHVRPTLSDCLDQNEPVPVDRVFLRRGMIPLWNLERVEVSTSMYPSPWADHVHYEHRIFAHRLSPGCSYLVADVDRVLQNVRLVAGDMLITCQEKGPVNWKLIQVNPSDRKLRYAYPLLANQPEESFASNLGALYQQGVKTRGELRRVILSYGYDSVVSFQDVELGAAGPAEAETYDMDQFITDELRKRETQETMLLHFAAADPGNFLNMDIMSFLVTKAQKLFPEYHCAGVLDA